MILYKKLFTISLSLFCLSLKELSAQDRINLDIPKIDGSGFFSSSELNLKKSILLFFNIECNSCLEKLDKIKNYAKINSNINIVLINCGDVSDAKNIISKFDFGKDIIILQAPRDSRNYLRSLGNKSSSIPYFILLSKDLKICLKKDMFFSDEEINNCN